MKLLYIVLLVGSFLMGIYDNGDITFFVMVLLFGVIAGVDKLMEKNKKKVGE